MVLKRLLFSACSLGLSVFVLVYAQVSHNAHASVIPDAYEVVALPYQPEVANFNAFTAINNNGLAVGYGTRDSRSMGFVFDYRQQQVIAMIDDFLPMSINDSNKIAGLYANQSNNVSLATCVLSDGICELALIEGAEFAMPLNADGLSNSGFLAAKQWLNTPDEQFLLYRHGQLIHNELAGPDQNGVQRTYVDMQRSNTRLIVGAYTDPTGVQIPFVQTINPDLSVSTTKLPAPGLDGGAGSGEAKAVNAMNHILLSTANGTAEGQLYVCDYLGDVDNDGLGDCQNGYRFIGPSGNPNYPYERYPLNDKGMLVAPPSYSGGEIHLYDLTAEQPVAVPLSSKGFNASIFAKTHPMAVNNESVILTSGAQTVLLVPQAQVPDISLEIHSAIDPIVVAADGSDRLIFTETLSNTTNISQTILYWRVLLLPDGTPYPRSTAKRLILEAGASVTESRARIRLPDYFPAGNYRYKLMAINESNGELFEQQVQIIKLP